MTDRMEKRIADVVLYGSVIAALIFFYIPIATLVLFSFTKSRFLSWPIPEFSTRWYGELLADRDFWSSLGNSALLAVLATLFATLLGIGGAFAWTRYKFRFQWGFRILTFAPLLFPQLLLGVVMLLWFSVLAGWLNLSPGLWSAVIGHVIYITPFCIVIISVQMQGYDNTLDYAAEDAGATRWQILREITLPLIWPGIFSAAVFAFLLSWGNFYITYSLSGSTRTLPTFVFSGIAVGSSPIYPALATLTFMPALVLIFAVDRLRKRAARRRLSKIADS
ncbi:MAG: ABC transporter permease [Thioclava marina]|uniref:ABC transporter permease n=1 Tax=Thioclava marina TaxID=1915077 RepID=UPI0019874F4C|nr:ABC transporter permease [Thioclava marina]MBC7145911.1 ABC transporter permease [Thioclava marina]